MDLFSKNVRVGRELSLQQAAALMRCNADDAEALLLSGADRMVEQKIIRLADCTGPGAFNTAGLRAEVGKSNASPPVTHPAPTATINSPQTTSSALLGFWH
jgi:hypothetical protein